MWLLLALACGDDPPQETSFDCARYCRQSSDDVAETGCGEPYTDGQLDACERQCAHQREGLCGSLAADYWQCTLDEFPGHLACVDGEIETPDVCDDLYGAWLICLAN